MRQPPQSSTTLRNAGTGAALVGFATLQGVNPASPTNRLDARTNTRPSFARNEFGEIRGLDNLESYWYQTANTGVRVP